LITFSEKEIEYVKRQEIARIATVSSNGQPDVVPVGFEYDGASFWIGSVTQDIFFGTTKYKNVRSGNRKVAIVFDDLESVNSWKPRQLKIYGTAEIVEHRGALGTGKYLQVTPEISWALGIHVSLPDTFQGLEGGRWRTKTIHNTTNQ
jgi:pyridoxamine 5'-phosphate oxidase family protein